jgi:hypothetical protein
MNRRIVVAASLALAAFGAGASRAAANTTPKPPAATFVARIGWYYVGDAGAPFPIAHHQAQVVKWGACAKAGGTQIWFPKGQHLYPDPTGNPTAVKDGFPIATLSGPPLDPSDPFTTELYVGDLATEHSGTITLACKRLKNDGHSGPLVTAFTGKLKIKYVHQNINFDPSGALGALPEFDLLEGGQSATVVDSNLACGEIGTTQLSVTSDAIAPDSKGSHTVVFTRTSETAHSLKDAEYRGVVTTADVPAGNYPATIECGTGQVGIGKIFVS